MDCIKTVVDLSLCVSFVSDFNPNCKSQFVQWYTCSADITKVIFADITKVILHL